MFSFEVKEHEFPESCGKAQLVIKRNSGARGKVRIPFKTFEDTAKPDVDYEGKEGEIEFDNDETELVENLIVFVCLYYVSLCLF